MIVEYEVDEIVLGYPKNMNDTEGERAEKDTCFQGNAGEKNRALRGTVG